MFQSENQQLLTLNNEKPEPCFWFLEQNDVKKLFKETIDSVELIGLNTFLLQKT